MCGVAVTVCVCFRARARVCACMRVCVCVRSVECAPSGVSGGGAAGVWRSLPVLLNAQAQRSNSSYQASQVYQVSLAYTEHLWLDSRQLRERFDLLHRWHDADSVAQRVWQQTAG